MNNIELKPSQKIVFDSITKFIDNKDTRIFILKGYAGTGKTTLMHFLIDFLNENNRSFKLLASTGRAAKILSNITHSEAKTIHSLIYKYKDLNEDLSDKNIDSDGQLFLIFEQTSVQEYSDPETIYIIDEASMVADVEEKIIKQAKFGSGRLLKDLLDYDTRLGSKFIFVGDPCQLPPITETFSPALSSNYLEEKLGIKVEEKQLTEIIRQNEDSTIISASKEIRSLWKNAPDNKYIYGIKQVWGKLPFGNHKDIILYNNLDSMMSRYIDILKNQGYQHATFICRSNFNCKKIALKIREQLNITSDIVQKGDLLLVIQNNMLSGLMNGDMVVVDEISAEGRLHAGFTFREVTVTELFSKIKYKQLLLEDTVHLNILNLDSAQQTALFKDFILRMKSKGISQKDKRAFNIAMLSDPYLNALRCVFGYAVTCNKAQGGEWNEVFIDMPRNITLNPTKETYQWIYTAMTRAKDKLHLVNEFYIK